MRGPFYEWDSSAYLLVLRGVYFGLRAEIFEEGTDEMHVKQPSGEALICEARRLRKELILMLSTTATSFGVCRKWGLPPLDTSKISRPLGLPC